MAGHQQVSHHSMSWVRVNQIRENAENLHPMGGGISNCVAPLGMVRAPGRCAGESHPAAAFCPLLQAEREGRFHWVYEALKTGPGRGGGEGYTLAITKGQQSAESE
eukprot:CAMPEP_0174356070 /NCGR_PEP_ID=MMETSP0811_2-20130205/28568_1 /TAXON_ID=73025 ORGANISM="Eutreptiella gymnastica-like, Strain CCMP1594" /NCGR_SAMPLE_ID=MMETSP0811_2 /ASSEMBLY_ACC=CAM_ASM_000667 /LENGTH=105 /DNA_ID=CAMNT_0015487885 /DNA_START=227 /DNA_END=541 /DNA_ORIENTATION=+